MSRGNGLISTTGSKANVMGDEHSQLCAAIAGVLTLLYLTILVTERCWWACTGEVHKSVILEYAVCSLCLAFCRPYVSWYPECVTKYFVYMFLFYKLSCITTSKFLY